MIIGYLLAKVQSTQYVFRLPKDEDVDCGEICIWDYLGADGHLFA